LGESRIKSPRSGLPFWCTKCLGRTDPDTWRKNDTFCQSCADKGIEPPPAESPYDICKCGSYRKDSHQAGDGTGHQFQLMEPADMPDTPEFFNNTPYPR
jgi:hypothetical protein